MKVAMVPLFGLIVFGLIPRFNQGINCRSSPVMHHLDLRLRPLQPHLVPILRRPPACQSIGATRPFPIFTAVVRRRFAVHTAWSRW
uniref:Secreted protein n=1 Tax=Arundo donax TaxID=35708 RepID=A0A0A9HSB1_ARUDO